MEPVFLAGTFSEGTGGALCLLLEGVMFPEEDEGELLHHGYETDTGVRDIKSVGKRMSKEERKKESAIPEMLYL